MRHHAVVFFTTALFLSGYAIQQRTLRDLREAIKPKPRPKIYLPDRFKKSTMELEDGTIVDIEDPVDHGDYVPSWERQRQQQQQQEQQVAIQVPPSVAQAIEGGADDAPARQEIPRPSRDEAGSRGGAAGEDGASSSSSWMSGDVDEKTQKPISRAERRRRIKQEIERLSQVESPMPYQRRLW